MSLGYVNCYGAAVLNRVAGQNAKEHFWRSLVRTIYMGSDKRRWKINDAKFILIC